MGTITTERRPASVALRREFHDARTDIVVAAILYIEEIEDGEDDPVISDLATAVARYKLIQRRLGVAA